MKPQFNPNDDRDNFHLLAGQIIRAWAELEGSLWLLGAAVLGVDQYRARIIFGSISTVRGKRELLTRLVENFVEESEIDTYRALMKRMGGLSKYRNLIAHAPMHINIDHKKSGAFEDAFDRDSGGALAIKNTPIDLQIMKTQLVAINTLKAEFINYLFVVGDKVHKQPKIHREQHDHPNP